MEYNEFHQIIAFVAGMFITGYTQNRFSSYYKRKGINRAKIGEKLPTLIWSTIFTFLFFLGVVFMKHNLRYGLYMYDCMLEKDIVGIIGGTAHMVLRSAYISLVIEEKT